MGSRGIRGYYDVTGYRVFGVADYDVTCYCVLKVAGNMSLCYYVFRLRATCLSATACLRRRTVMSRDIACSTRCSWSVSAITCFSRCGGWRSWRWSRGTSMAWGWRKTPPDAPVQPAGVQRVSHLVMSLTREKGVAGIEDVAVGEVQEALHISPGTTEVPIHLEA